MRKKCTRGISSGNTGEMVNDVYLPHEIVIDILTRLPAKVYEIFTLGTHSWRKIDAVPPSPYFPFGFGGICVNGVIYWRSTSTKPSSTIDKEVIVAFDLKEERFRVIPLPDGPSAKPCLRELGGQLAACEDFPEDVPEELWILEDYENWVWVKVIITPPRNFVFADYFHTNGAIQTGEILLHSPPNHGLVFVSQLVRYLLL
ncbi:hypothetical protein RHMOL_Rhmol04G0126200 [Rhododendron molle]|uniref:Uncharacterized protein n=1 Tax=Rhododendron molle TaxID=49168 RepID=A0ACC0P231_RHOML|nr:hypothetical protein RHMOL_Rhmol04G0126200 [Rhododendron molle]